MQMDQSTVREGRRFTEEYYYQTGECVWFHSTQPT